MKKLYTFIIIFICSFSCKAQVYYPMLDSVSNVWYYVANVFPVLSPQSSSGNCNYGSASFGVAGTLITTGDTIINSTSYKILEQHDPGGGNDCRFGYLREDTTAKKIYFVDNIFSPEEILYDFSMQIGNSINLNFFQSFGIYSNGSYTLDSIGLVSIPAGLRNIFFLNNHAMPFSPTMTWIESVGHTGHLVYSRSANSSGGFFGIFCNDYIDRNFYQMLTCFEHASSKIYFDSCAQANALNNPCVQYQDSCNYWNICGSVEELGSVKSFTVSPNPAKEEITLTIQTDKKTKADFIVRDIAGKEIMISKTGKILSGSESFKWDIGRLAIGIYIIECRIKEGSLYRKLVIE
jgi:hypothetical protein